MKHNMDAAAAIRVLERMGVDMTSALVGLSRMDPMVAVMAQRIEAVNAAQAALREQEIREQGCVSCNGGFGDNTVEFRKLHYKVCPYCARKLMEV